MANVNLIGPSYSDATLPLAAQECINYYPETVEVEGARNVIALKGSPGLFLFGTVGTGPIRGMATMADVLYVVSGTSLYSVDDTGTGTSLGTVAGTGPVGMANNGYQLVVVNGGQGYVYNNQTLIFGQITDPDFQVAYTCAFLDQYIIFDGPNGEFFISAIADATAYDALDFATAEAAPDPTLAVFVDHLELWVFGSETIQVYQDTGDADFPFQQNTGVILERGLGARYSIQKIDNTIYWLAEDGMVYAAKGYVPQRISTYPIEQDIQSLDFSNAIATSYRFQGHWFYVLTLPDGKTWVYDAATKMWHRRKSYGLDRWRLNNIIYIYGLHIGGDYSTGKLWELSNTVYAEGDDPLLAERKTQYISNNQGSITNPLLEIVFDTGHGLTTGQGSDPVVDFRYSDDGGRNFTNFKQRSLGKIGQYGKRVKFRQLGQFRERVFHWRVSDPVKRDVIAAAIRVEGAEYI